MFNNTINYRVRNEIKRNEITRLQEKVRGLQRENANLKQMIKENKNANL